MNGIFKLGVGLCAAGVILLPAAQASAMTKADYKAGKAHVEAEYKTNAAGCDALAGNAKDICIEEAKGKRNVALAEVEFHYTGKHSDKTKLSEAQAEAAYAVEMEKCDDKAGNVKDVCVQEAKAEHTKALANAKAGKEIHAAKREASEDKRDADYKVALEKCDALAGNAKDSCVAASKNSFGKN